ncbi:hypothetical protein F5X68DRAFT_272349 [Plectosphaerella plurivora]|uniref:Protein kinase domain-containing protein n=1 Tax=Plectosphaerella plurivora TaxID=936078 RepID=A0A9P8VMZ8_9PEZI|nr:hypothetical protein F5X68DRAFT_272349 [Plectosphaerella plurivora]
MDPGVAIAGIQVCWVVGKILVESCQTWRAAQEELADRIAIIEHAWQRTRMQLEFIERLTLDEEYRRTLDELARILATRLSAAITAINRAVEKESKKRPGFLEFGEGVRKSKYMFVKSAIDDAIKDVEEWQRRFDPSWFLVMRVAGPAIDEELKSAKGKEERDLLATRTGMTGPKVLTRSPFQAAEGLRQVLRNPARASIFLPNIALEKQAIPHSSVQRAVFRGGSSDKDQRSFFIESIICRPGADLNALTADTRKLASRLTAADPLAFGLLNCKGVIKVPGDVTTGQSPSFTMVYRPPDGFKPEDSCSSLRDFLLINTRKPSGASLSRRIAVAHSLARSVSSIHTFEFVHKNIRPESVLLLGDDVDAGATFLLGFDSFREADGATYLLGDDVSWDRNLYRHPTRHGNFITERYRMHHDVYSLGVCLLELGLGESFVAFDADGLPTPASRLAEDFGNWLKTTGRESGEVTGRFEESAGLLKHSKDYLEHLAATQLPQCAGTRYTQAVMACLSCLDDDKSQVEEDDTYGIEVGMGFIQNILGQLDEILV